MNYEFYFSYLIFPISYFLTLMPIPTQFSHRFFHHDI
jgi:hypothetical protein